MAFFRTVAIMLCIVLLMGVLADKKKGKKNRMKEKHKKSDEIETAGECPVQKVQFSFHGDDEHDHDHSHADGDVHVHVHLHDDRHDRHHHSGEEDHFHHEHKAICKMSNASPNVDGSILIVQADHDGAANFQFDFASLGDADTSYTFHVHQFGDISDGCAHIGGHYDPYHKNVDVGDLGTVDTDSTGAVVDQWKNDTHLTMWGDHSILGRSIMVHGSDGKGITCCVIGTSPDTHDHDMDHSHAHDHSTHDHHDHDHHDHDHDHGHDHHH